LVDRTGNDIAPAYYVIAAAVATLITLLTMRETAGRPLPRRMATDQTD
jgi:MHS family proline/betaine transporter-like MFS transporter